MLVCGIGQIFKAGGLPPVESLVVFRIIAYQRLNKRGLEFFDFGLVVISELKFKLRLAAFFDGHACYISVRVRIPKNGGAELRVDKDPTMFPGDTPRQRKLEGVVNDRLALDYSFSLFLCQRTFPAKQSCFERTAMIEW
jgi:hypothetical protein